MITNMIMSSLGVVLCVGIFSPGFSVTILTAMPQAGSVLANRLSEDPAVTVALIEGGPSDVGLKEVQILKNWLDLLGTKYDYSYGITEQPKYV
jgi:hypothetical protein